MTRFGGWTDASNAVENRLPWINNNFFNSQPEYVVTTSADSSFWGTLVTMETSGFRHSPWMADFARNSGNVLYWIREEE